MSSTKEISKRQARREQIRRKEQRGRIIGIGLITIGAIFVAFLFIYPSFKPAKEVSTPEPHSYKQVDKTSQGDPKAPVKIDVYEDYQCPACSKFSEDIEPLIIKDLVETGKVFYTFHDYPFIDGPGADNGGESDQSANAAMCAAEQGKFWEMHGTIFANWNGENLGAYSDQRLRAFAETVGLDMDVYDSCFNANKYQKDIQADFDTGTELGVNGTPSVFVNGKILDPGYVPSYENIAAAVEAALTGSGN